MFVHNLCCEKALCICLLSNRLCWVCFVTRRKHLVRSWWQATFCIRAMYADLWQPIIQILALEKSAVLLEMRYGVTLVTEFVPWCRSLCHLTIINLNYHVSYCLRSLNVQMIYHLTCHLGNLINSFKWAVSFSKLSKVKLLYCIAFVFSYYICYCRNGKWVCVCVWVNQSISKWKTWIVIRCPLHYCTLP